MKVCACFLLVSALWVGVAAAQTSPVLIEHVAHVGDPVPGIPGTTFYGVGGEPRIDAAGNVLFLGGPIGPGIDASNDLALFYGQPGNIQPIMRESWQAPDMPDGVIIDDLNYCYETLSETGWISFTSDLIGTGITPGVNDRAVFVGPPGDFRMVLQGGDQAPGLPEGITIDLSDSLGFGGRLSGNATCRVVAYVAGPGVDYTNNRVYWTGPRDNLQPVFRTGMPAPGCEPGVCFEWADLLRFNDAGQLAFRGGLVGPGVTDLTHSGRWVGGPGELQLITRGGGPAPCFPPEITLAGAGGGITGLNDHGDVNELTLIQGPGVTADNDLVFYAGQPGSLHLVAREGDLVSEAGSDVWIDGIGTSHINSQREVFYHVKLDGPSIDDSNRYAVYIGRYDAPELTIRDGNPAPHFSADVVLGFVGGITGRAAGNDTGDWLFPCYVNGPGISEDNRVVFWLRDYETGELYPLLQSGQEINGRIVAITSDIDVGGTYSCLTGGSDGAVQSFNDSGQLAIRLPFSDGSKGIYRITPPLFGDANGDGMLDGRDIAPFSLAVVDRVAYEAQYPDCDTGAHCDLNGDGIVDTEDVELFLTLLMVDE